MRVSYSIYQETSVEVYQQPELVITTSQFAKLTRNLNRKRELQKTRLYVIRVSCRDYGVAIALIDGGGGSIKNSD
jgi:hypothetical protein